VRRCSGCCHQCAVYLSLRRLLFVGLCLQLHNLTSQPQEVQVSVTEAHSVVYSGDKQQMVTCLPRDTHSITWTLVAHAPGQVPLPVVKVSSARFNAQTVTQNCSIKSCPFEQTSAEQHLGGSLITCVLLCASCLEEDCWLHVEGCVCVAAARNTPESLLPARAQLIVDRGS